VGVSVIARVGVEGWGSDWRDEALERTAAEK